MTALAAACSLTLDKHPPSEADLQGGADAGLDAGNVDEAEAALPMAIPKLHRPTASPCTEARSSTVASPCNVGNDAGCTSDQECDGGASGRCTCVYGPSYFASRVCTYDQCASDGDCTNAACICRETILRPGTADNPTRITWCALAGNCRLDSDCGPAGYCSPSAAFQCGPDRLDYYGYYCHTANDECVNDSDCAPQGNAFCAYNPAVKRWACSTSMCADG